MKYKITHTTTYDYKSPVHVCHNLVLQTPREDGFLRSLKHKIQVSPKPDTFNHRRDFFGNQLVAFSVEQSHRQLVVTARSKISLSAKPEPLVEQIPSWQQLTQAIRQQQDPRWLEASAYLYDSPRIHRDHQFAEYAKPSFTTDRPIVEAVLDLTKRINCDFVYDPVATKVHTSPQEAFQLRRGVCQDFAHVQIACLRSLGVPVRYVSGYLRTMPPPGKPRMVGADQSHAWLSAYCGGQVGWIEFDPTNKCICSLNHIPVAWGRDYDDVAPLRGVFLGGGQHTIKVSVDVAPYDELGVKE